VRSHLRASSAGSTSGRGNGLGSIRGAFAGRGVSSDADGSSALSLRLIGALAALALLVVFAPSAQAAPTRTYQSSFGSFSNPQPVAVDQASGDVYVLDVGAAKVLRFKPNGEPDPFSASAPYIAANELSGSTVGAFSFYGGASEQQLAVAPPGSPAGTAGDLYVTESGAGAIDVFAPSGEYLGRITEAGGSGFSGEICGVAVDPSGKLYIGSYGGEIYKYVPSANPPTSADYDSQITGVPGPCNIAAGSSSVYASTWSTGPLTKYPASLFPGGGGSADASSSGSVIEVGGNPVASTTAYVDPSSEELYVDEGNKISVFDSSGAFLYGFGSSADFGSNSAGVAVIGSNGNAYVADRANGEIDVYGPVLNPPTATTNPATTIHHTSAVLNGHLAPNEDPAITACSFEWGKTEAPYEHTTHCNEGNSFSAPADVSANLGFLTPGTRIHFRLHIDTTSSGEVDGEDQSFTPQSFPTDFDAIATFGSDGTDATTFPTNAQLAFDQVSRRLYALNRGTPNEFSDPGLIYGFDASAPPAYPGLPGFAPLTTTVATGGSPALAVDNTALASAGNIYYVSEGQQKVYGFDSSGAPLGGNFPIAPGGGVDLCGAAVDSSGNLWVGDYSHKAILEYDSAGNPIPANTISTSEQGQPCRIAFDSNDDLYVALFRGVVWRYSAASGYSSGSATQVDPGDGSNGVTGSIAVDPANDHLYVAHHASVNAYDASGNLIGTFATAILGAFFNGITVDATNHYIYVSDEGNHKVRVFVPGAVHHVPTLTPGDPTAITDSSATLHAKVDPETFQVTDCHFEYLTDSAFQANAPADRFAGAVTAPCSPDPGSGSGDVNVHADISSLNGGTTYHFRILAANATDSATGPDQTFVTEGPVISSQAVESVSFTDATLSAKINPKGEATTYHVEYGTSAAYGQSTAESLPIGFPGDESAHTVSVHVGGLNPGIAYHFRFVANNSDGISKGLDTAFATYSAPLSFAPCPNDSLRSGAGARLPDCRAYEQATPIDKHGANAQGTINEIEASSGGDRVTFFLNGGLPTSDGSSSLSPYMASRGPDGWSSAGLLPATDPGYTAGVVGWSDDLSSTVVTAPGPGNVGKTLFLRDSNTGAFQLGTGLGSSGEEFLAGFAADTSHLIFEHSGPPLLPGAAGQDNLYDLDHGALTLAGRIPAGSATSCDDEAGPACEPAPAGSFAGSYNTFQNGPGGAKGGFYTQNTISRDGSRVFFTAAGTDQLYVRENGTTTTQISASQRTTPDPNGERPAAFMAATPDGSKVFFTSCEKLTDDSTAVSNGENSCTTPGQGQDLYSYDVDTGQLSDLSVDSNAGDPRGADVLGVLGTSADGSYVYFAANGELASGASPGNCGIAGGGTCNLYLYHDGTITFIARVDGADFDDWTPVRQTAYQEPRTGHVSADGRTLLFGSQRSLTGYDNTNPAKCDGACQELFRYTAADEGGLACVSCNPTGVPPKGAAQVGAVRLFLHTGIHFFLITRNLSADGKRVFFDTPDALLPTDINGVTDVYEWEANGSGSCHTPGGCIYLISSGTSGDLSYFADASANGDHVFFFTDQQLVPSDRDQLYDVYDASVEGGLPSQHTLAPPTCSSTACQANPAPPPEQTPASAAFSGPGNVHESAKTRGCPKGKRKVRQAGKVRCQKAHKRHKRHTNRGGSK
jgi:hypothetical protein